MQTRTQTLVWRIAWKGAALVALLLTWPIGYLCTRNADTVYVAWGGAFMVAAMLVLLAADVLEWGRATRADHESPSHRLDAVWDHAAADEQIWDRSRALGRRGALTGTAERDLGDSNSEGVKGFLARLEAGRPTTDRRRRVMLALENATLALGVGLVPTVWTLGGTACLNAFLASEPDQSVLVMSQNMIDTFTDEELMAVCANLLCRRAEDASFTFDDGLLTPTPGAEYLFRAAMQLYFASDRRTLLAMRNAGPLASALMKTRSGEGWSRGATIRDAFAAWTWPGGSPIVTPRDPLTFLQMATEVARGSEPATAPRVEGLRLSELARVAAIDT